MERDLQRMAAEPYDLVIIGGGINGLAAAWDASLRGLRTALVEQGDYGAATSSATLKLVHGGLRYLQHLDLRRMRESIRERSTLLRIAPHLVSPLPFLVQTRGHWMQGKELMSTAILLNDLISFDRNLHLSDPARRLPPGRAWLSPRRCRELAPELDAAGATGGVQFYDAQMYNSERLTLAFGLSAAERGADLANHAQVIGFERRGQRVEGVRVRDLLDGSEHMLRAAVVANMTGPWSDIVTGLLERSDPPRRVLRSKGIQIVTPLITADCGLGVPSRHKDPDAVVDRGGRLFFITPWRGHSLVGTTDTIYEGDPDHFRITKQDIADFVAEINDALPGVSLSPDDVPFAFGGLRPVTEKNIDTGSSVARKYEITDHARTDGVENLVSVVGVKYTTCRFLAEQVVHLVFRKLGRSSPAVATDCTRLVGGEIERIEPFTDEAIQACGGRYPVDVVRHLVANYGTCWRDVVALADGDPALAALVPGSGEVLRAELVHALRNECCGHLDDLVLRRTDLGTLGHPGDEALQCCAELAQVELGWDDARCARERQRMEELFVFPDAPSSEA